MNNLKVFHVDGLWYHGRIYEFELKAKLGTPYFLDFKTMPGSLTYNKKLHTDLTLSYNLIMDELILWGTGSGGKSPPIVLNKYSVEKFTLKKDGRNYHFRLNTEMKPIHDHLKEGFYEVIYDDKLSMFIKHKMKLSTDPGNLDKFYESEKQIYLILEGNIFVINNRGDYISAFQDHEKSLRKYMRQRSINFDRSDTQVLIELCNYSKTFLN